MQNDINVMCVKIARLYAKNGLMRKRENNGNKEIV